MTELKSHGWEVEVMLSAFTRDTEGFLETHKKLLNGAHKKMFWWVFQELLDG